MQETITLNQNQATCMVERATLEGRQFVNVCTGQTMTLPYTVGEIAFSAIFGVFFIFIAVVVLNGFLSFGRNHSRFK